MKGKRKCKYSGCKKEFIKNLTKIIDYCCSPDCYYSHLLELKAKKANKDWQEEKKIKKEKLKTLTEYEKEAKREFQHWIRLRDKDQNCISCNCSVAKQWDGGHYLKAELFSGLIFNENNCHKQCSRCNDLYSGHELEYRDGLIKRYGEQYVKDMESIKDANRNYKYTKEQLTEIKEFYKAKIKELI